MKNGKELGAVIERLLTSFEKVLYEEDAQFLENMKKRNVPAGELEKYRFWEWTQGVGLFGVWKLYDATGDERYLHILTSYYDRQLAVGLPGKNVNTVTPLLPLAFLAERFGDARYLAVCREWAEWILESFPRTPEGGFQHITSDCVNEGELWDDTLFMTVLFLAKFGAMTGDIRCLEEAEYQFLLHVKYLADEKTGLWYHGWSFSRGDHFAGAFWGRGNCWVTAAIPEYLSIAPVSPSVRRFLVSAWERQAASLVRLQEADGMWHTLLDDPTSYVESSATCGFGYGLLRGVSMGFGKSEWAESALRALPPILALTGEDGVLGQTSYGTPMGRESKDFYKQIPIRPMPYGQALEMLFLMESRHFLERLGAAKEA